jgi:hypothetical protein
MTPAERQARWNALLAAKNAEITRLRDLIATARMAALREGAEGVAKILAGGRT